MKYIVYVSALVIAAFVIAAGATCMIRALVLSFTP